MTKFNSAYPLHPIYAQALTEHHDIGFERERLDAAFRVTAAPDYRRIRRVLPVASALRDRLARCFAREEAGGYLEEATIRLPRLSVPAKQLQQRRGELLTTLQELIVGLTNCASQEDWDVLHHRYVQLSQHMREHEAAEMELLERAFNDDQGNAS